LRGELDVGFGKIVMNLQAIRNPETKNKKRKKKGSVNIEVEPNAQQLPKMRLSGVFSNGGNLTNHRNQGASGLK